MGLNAQASRDIVGLIATGNQAVATLTGSARSCFHALGLVPPYERTAPKGLFRHSVVAFTLYISFQVELFDWARPVGGRGLVFLSTFVTSTLFWWWPMRARSSSNVERVASHRLGTSIIRGLAANGASSASRVR